MPEMIRPVSGEDNTACSDIVSSLDGMAHNNQADADRLKEIFNRVVRNGRKESTTQFAKRSGIGGDANVRHYLNGRNHLNLEIARKFAASIPCAIEDFSPHWARIAHATGQVAHVDKRDPHEHGVAPLLTNDVTLQWGSRTPPQSAKTLRIPLLLWGRMDLMLEDNESLMGMPGVEFVESDNDNIGKRTKFIDMPDRSMEPRILEGDRLTIEPDWMPEAGEVVVLKDKHGAYHVRTYKQIRPGHFIAAPFNQNDYIDLDSIADGLEPVGVVIARREFLAKRKR